MNLPIRAASVPWFPTPARLTTIRCADVMERLTVMRAPLGPAARVLRAWANVETDPMAKATVRILPILPATPAPTAGPLAAPTTLAPMEALEMPQLVKALLGATVRMRPIPIATPAQPAGPLAA